MSALDLSHYLKEVNRTFYDQVKTADQKALYVFSIVVALVIFWTHDSKQGFSWITSANVSPRWVLAVCFTVAVCFTIISAVLVVAPRMLSSASTLFWGSWPAAADRLKKTPPDQAADLIIGDYIENIQNLAAICKYKYRYVGFAYRGLVATILLYMGLLAVG